jgi:hypothetical protein
MTPPFALPRPQPILPPRQPQQPVNGGLIHPPESLIIPPEAGQSLIAPPSPSTAGPVSQSPQSTPALPPALLEALNGPIQTFISDAIDADLTPEKTIQYTEARRSHLYWEGYQYLYPELSGGQIIDYRQIPQASGLQNLVPDAYANRGLYDAVINWILGDGNKFIAVLGNRSPNPKALPLRPDNEDHQRRAKRADRILQSLRKLWPVDEVQAQLALHAWKDGTFFLHTPYEVDPEKYGTTRIPILEQSQVDGPDGLPMDVPIQTGIHEIPNGAPGLYPETIFTTTVSFFSRTLRDAGYLRYEFEVPKGELILRYPQLKSHIGDDNETSFNSSLSMMGSITRSIQASTYGRYYTHKRHKWLYTQIWLRPYQYVLFDQQMVDLTAINGESNSNVQDFFTQLFPNGCKLVLVNGRLVDVEASTLDDEWSVGKPGVSPYIYCHPVSRPLIPIQDMINEQFNLFRETVERNIPFCIADRNVIDFEAWRRRPGVPGELIPALATMGGKLSEAIVKGPVAEIEPEVERWVGNMFNVGREISGVLPAIFGGDEGTQTAREAIQRRNQALQSLGLPWTGMRAAWKGAYENGLKIIVKHGAQVLTRFGLSEFDIEEIAELIDEDGHMNGFAVQIEEQIPVTWGAIRDAVMQLIQTNSLETWHLTGLDHPANASRIQEALGMTDWVVPGSSVREYTMDWLRKLIKAQPTLGQDPITGEAILSPSEPINDFAVDPPVAIAIIKDWMLSDEGRGTKENNPVGWQNVMAGAMAWKRLMAMQAMQMGGGGQGAPPGGPPPGGGGGMGGGGEPIPPVQPPPAGPTQETGGEPALPALATA